VTNTQGGQVQQLAGLALQLLNQREYGRARDVLVALAQALPPDASARNTLLSVLTPFGFHVAGQSTPPPQLVGRIEGILRQFISPAQTQASVNGDNRHSTASKAKKYGPLGAALAFLAKFKTAALIFATKGKFLLLGLTKFKALLSLLAFLGVYWALFGWWFAVGFIASIFIHEMGHYVTVRRYGFSADAPVFSIFGAYVRWRGTGVDLEKSAVISLAGPMFGLVAAVASYMIFAATGSGVWLAVAHAGAFINLFNLIPAIFFDGLYAFMAIGRQERFAILIVSLVLWFFLIENMFLFIALGAAYRLYKKDHPVHGSQSVAYYFIGLLIALGLFDWWILQRAGTLFPGTNPYHGNLL
jgi:Zn-dependent protease